MAAMLGMELLKWTGDHGLAKPGNLALPGGRGHCINNEERIQILRMRDAGLTNAEISRRIGRLRRRPVE